MESMVYKEVDEWFERMFSELFCIILGLLAIQAFEAHPRASGAGLRLRR